MKPDVQVQEVTERLTGPTVSSGKAGRAGTGSDQFVAAAAWVAAVAVGAPGARLWNTTAPA